MSSDSKSSDSKSGGLSDLPDLLMEAMKENKPLPSSSLVQDGGDVIEVGGIRIVIPDGGAYRRIVEKGSEYDTVTITVWDKDDKLMSTIELHDHVGHLTRDEMIERGMKPE